MAHCIVPEAEAILDRSFPVLDHGFIRLVDYLGGDARIAQSARVSYGEGTRSWREDAGLIDYLLRHDHSSPFEQVVLTFHIKLPIFVARQWIRHRTARVNEISGRYSVMKDEFYLPADEDVALQSKDNKQGRAAESVSGDQARQIREELARIQQAAYQSYHGLVEAGIARELARVALPLALYTEWYWQIDLHNLFHFLALRMDSHAQKEIRAYAEVMFSITKAVAPLATASFERHILRGVHFSRDEFLELQRRLGIENSDSIQTGEGSLPLTGQAASPPQEAGSALSDKDLERLETKLRTGKTL